MSKNIKGKRLCFIHVPKCGGISFNEAFRKALQIGPFSFGMSSIHAASTRKEARRKKIDAYVIREKLLIQKLSNPRNKYVKGHVSCPPSIRSDFNDQWVFLTILRDPVKRWISQYFYNMYKKIEPMEKEHIPLDEYLNHPVAREAGTLYVRYFSGEKDLNSDKAIQTAIQNLEKFDILGILEDMKKFHQDFQSIFGSSLLVKNRNVNPYSKNHIKSQISEDHMEMIRELCEPDMKIYQHFISAQLSDQ